MAIGYKQRKAISDLIFQPETTASLIRGAHVRTQIRATGFLFSQVCPVQEGLRPQTHHTQPTYAHSPCDNYHSQVKKGKKREGKKDGERKSPMDDICSLSL